MIDIQVREIVIKEENVRFILRKDFYDVFSIVEWSLGTSRPKNGESIYEHEEDLVDHLEKKISDKAMVKLLAFFKTIGW